MSKLSLKYFDVAVGAKESLVPDTGKLQEREFSEIGQLNQNIGFFENYGNPLEGYSVSLDGGISPVPSDPSNTGFWSQEMTDGNGDFEQPVTISFDSDKKFTSNSLRITFDNGANIYATRVHIYWYGDGELISDAEFYPDSAVYVFENRVELFNSVVFEFYSLNTPNCSLRIKEIQYGQEITIGGGDILAASVTQKSNPISVELPVSTASINIISNSGKEYYFQKKQPIKVVYGNDLISTVFVKTAKKSNAKKWDLTAEDNIGRISEIPFAGGMYRNALAVDILTKISDTCKADFYIDVNLRTERVTGYIPYTNCREALMQVAFAIGAFISTDYSDGIKVSKLPEIASQEIGLGRIMMGQAVEDGSIVTSVSLAYHGYKRINDIVTVYDAEESGTGEDIMVMFNEPLHTLYIENGRFKERHVNYAVVDAYEGCVLTGKGYKHTQAVKTVHNPNVTAVDGDNDIQIKTATLISDANVDKILSLCYNHYKNERKLTEKIIEGYTKDQKSVRLGDRIVSKTVDMGDIEGVVYSQKFNLSGGFLAKETEIAVRE